MLPVIIVHGGAGKISDNLAEKRLLGVQKALDEGWTLLNNGGKALDAVVEAVRVMEDYPWLNAGIGSSLNYDGFVEMDALVMDGSTLRAGAVAAVRRIKNPVLAAKLIMEKTKHILLVGEGAERFMSSLGMDLIDPKILVTQYQKERWMKYREEGNPYTYGDTVGGVAIDINGNIAVAVSTGGLFLKIPGRVGDTPIVGAGGYADSAVGGASVTGLGEAAMRVLLSKTIIDFLKNGFDPMRAAREGIKLMEKRVGGRCGAIVLDKYGRIGFYKNTDVMIFGFRTPKERVAKILKD